jgi:abhydrolase domain-containing protein 1/3
VLQVRDCWDFDKILGSRTLREFDAHFTAPQFGYESVLDYYKDAVVLGRVNQFSIPVFGELLFRSAVPVI